MNNIIPKENYESECFAQWLRIKNIRFTHIANESWLPPKVAMIASFRKKRMGVSKWVPDFMIIVENNHKRSLLFIEMKRIKWWTLSPEQKEWIEALNEIDNIQAQVCKWHEDAITFVEKFI